jgi:glycosyltransferase involved in cell wall biosynthesis
MSAPAPPTVCLNMIVKNEEKVIERALRTFFPLYDTWCIIDTGSTDRTMEIITSFFEQKGMKGQLHQRPWVDFEYNRNEALELARAMLGPEDYCLLADADEELVIEPGFRLPKPLTATQYTCDIQHGCRFARTRFYKAHYYEWWYPTHEALCPAKEFQDTCHFLPKLWINSHTDGARAQDPARWLRDAASLDAAIEIREKDELWRGKPLKLSRLYFYSGNSYFHAGEYAKALQRYEQRMVINEFDEEVFQAYYMRAKAKKELKRPRDEAVGAFLEAYLQRPTRYEPIYHLVSYLMENGDYEGARLFAAQLRKAVAPVDILFVEEWCYREGKHLASLLLDPTPTQAIQLATHQYVHKRWHAVLETLRPLKLKDLSPQDKFTYHDLSHIAYSWLGRKPEGLASVLKIFLMPLKHWRSHLKRMVESYVEYYGQPLSALSDELQREYARELAAPAGEAVAIAPVVTTTTKGKKKPGKLRESESS